MTRPSPSAAFATWRSRWGGIAPLLVAEFIVWLGFGCLLPVLPLYFTDQGVDLATLGVVIAAWPAARLVGEPIFGWLADRTARVPLMVAGLVLAGVFTVLPLFVAGPLAFIVLRAAVGLATAIYDPAARGYLTDATPVGASRRGVRALRGRADGRPVARDRRSGPSGPTGSGASASSSSSAASRPSSRRSRSPGWVARADPGRTRRRHWTRRNSRRFAVHLAPSRGGDVAADRGDATVTSPPSRLLNRGLIAALVINAGGNFAAGTYDVIWSLFLQGLGAGLGPDRTDVRHVRPADPDPLADGRPAGRPRGSFAFIVLGSIVPAISGILYTRLVGPDLAIPLDPHRGDRLRPAQPGALLGRGGQLAAGSIVDGPGPVRGRRDGRVHHRLARRRRPGRRGHPLPVLRVQRRADPAASSSACWSAVRRLRGRAPAGCSRDDADAFDRTAPTDYRTQAGWSSGSSSGS